MDRELTEEEIIRRKAEAHVDWFLTTIRPLLITHFEHGYKHGKNDTN